MKFCPDCGGALNPEAKFCSGCGKALSAAGKSGKRRWIIAAVVIVLALVGLRIYGVYDEENLAKEQIARDKQTPIDTDLIGHLANGRPSEDVYDLDRLKLDAKTGYDLDPSPDAKGGGGKPPKGGPASMRN